MKKMNYIHKTLLLTGIAATLLVACSKESVELKTPDVGETPNGMIALSSSVLNTDVAQNRAIIEGGTVIVPAIDLYFARADGEGAAGNYTPYANNAIKATRTAGVAADETPITWATGSEQYYQTNGRNTILTAWYPGGATTDDDVTGKGYYNPIAQSVTWTIDGSQDIMTAPRVTGNKTNPIGNIAFGHRLAAVLMQITAEDTYAQNVWGNVLNVSICNQRTQCTYNLADALTGAVSFKGSATTDFELYNDNTGFLPSTTTTAIKRAAMIEPQSSSYTLKMAITTTKGGTQYIYLTQELRASIKYSIKVMFTTTGITLSAAIIPWETPVNEDIVVDGEGVTKVPDIGDYYYSDGTYSTQLVSGKTAEGLIFDRDATNPKKHLVMGLQESSRAMDTWANMEKYCNDYTGESKTDPAGTWRLPTKDELQHLYCVINGAPTTTWDVPGNTGAPSLDATAFGNWNARLTAISATTPVIVSGKKYWSSTEIPSKGYLVLDMKDGNTYDQPPGTQHSCRCIRSVE